MMNVEDMMLSVRSQSEKRKCGTCSLMESGGYLPEGRGVRGLGEKGKRLKKCKLAVTE